MLDQRLITFLTVCRTLSFTKAAELLNLTQPAVTKHIKALEEHFGATLFSRDGRSIEITESGKILLKHVMEMEAQASVLERKIKNSVGGEKRYSIGATLTIGEYVLPHILARYKESMPLTDIVMQVKNTEMITQALLAGELDLGLIEGPFDRNKYLFELLKEDELVFAVSPENGLSKRHSVTIDQMLQSKLILREDGSGTRKVLEDKLASLGFGLGSYKPFMEIGSIGAIKSLVELNLGTTIISKTAIQKEVKAGSLVIIPMEDVEILREFNFIYLKDCPKAFVNDFIKFSRKAIE